MTHAMYPIYDKTSSLINLIFVLLCSLYSTALLAENIKLHKHSNTEIQAAAIKFVREKIPQDIKIEQIIAAKIDSRIRFKQCSQALETHSSMNRSIAKSWSVNVRCNDSTPWSIYINVKTKLTKKMLVSNKTIIRGEQISSNKVKLIDSEITNPNQKYFSDLSDIIGYEARKTIRPNRVINSTMLQKALLVHKKEPVLIYAQGKNIHIRMQGTALKNGRQNEMIKVRNNSSNKIIDAMVIERGVVAINF
jgi:flagellar basal body P-ring formation protein FlgA